MVCVLSDKQERAFLKKILKDVYTNIEAGNPFELKAYVSSVYNAVLNHTKNVDMAITYAAIVPENLMTLLGPIAPIRDYLIPSIAEINEQAKQSAQDPMNIINLLGLDRSEIDKELEKESTEQEENKKSEIKEQQKTSATPKASISIRPYTFDSTTGDDSDSDLQFSYSFLQNLLNGDKVISEETGYYITLMNSSEVLGNITLQNKGYAGGVLQAITDADGNVLYFDSNFNPTDKETGVPVFFRLREKRDTVQTIKELVKTQGLSEEQAIEYVDTQKANVKKKKEFVLSGPGKRVVQKITGGSFGYIQSGDLYADLSVAEDLSDSPLRRIDQYKAFGRGPYKDVIPFKMKSVSSDKTFLEDAISIILGEKLVDEMGKTSEEKLLLYREKFFKVYFNNNFNVFFGKKEKTKGKIYVKVAGGVILERPILATRENLMEALTTNIVKDLKTGEDTIIEHVYNVYAKDAESTPSYTKKADGTIMLTGNGTSPVQYRKWLQNHSTSNKPYNSETGKFQDRNGYFIFETFKEVQASVEGPATETKKVAKGEPVVSGTMVYAPTDELRKLHNAGTALYTMRVSEKQAKSKTLGFKGLDQNKHFGNPFTGTDVKNQVPMADIPAAVNAYEKWLDGQNIFIDKNGESHDLSDQSARRAWINSEIQRLKLKGGIQLGYFASGYKSHADILNERINGTIESSKVTPEQSKIETVIPGVEIKRNVITEEEQLELFNILKPYIEQQGAKTNKAESANVMIGLGLRWDYKSNNPNYKAVEIKDIITPGSSAKYGYYEVSINGQPLGPINPRIKELMSKATGVDATNYDGAIINLYTDDTFISSHNDVDEALDAIGYPVLVLNIGGSGNFSVEQSKKYTPTPLNAGDAYLFGIDGKNRKVMHRTFPSKQNGFLPAITTKIDGKTYSKGSYRVSITLRRVKNLEPGMPAIPRLLGDKLTSAAPVTPAKTKPTFVPKTFTVPTEASRTIKKSDKDVFNKLKDQGVIGEDITEEQIAKAKEWYDSNPISKVVPYEVMFHIINTQNPKSIATFSRAAITLYKGSDFTDLYHEAWHAFTQMFLTSSERNKLYKELSKKSGTFKAFDGTTVSFAKATPQQLEEYLAEDFRQYMLAGGKLKGSEKAPVKKSIFKHILDFLKAVFNINNDTVFNDESVSNLLSEVYNKLRIGDINPVPYGLENTKFTHLDKLKAISDDDQDLIDEMGYAQAMKIVNAIDSIFSQYVDQVSKDHGVNYAASLLSDPSRRTAAYNEVITQFVLKYNDLSSKLAEMSSEDLGYDKLYSTVKTLELAITNFASSSTSGQELTQNDVISALQKDEGVLGFHIKKSKYLQFDETYDLLKNIEEEDPDSKTVKDRDGYGHKSGNDVSMRELASAEVLYTIRSLYKYEGNKLKLDDFGFPELNDFDISWNKIQKVLTGSMNVDDIYKKLQGSKDKVIQHLLEKLGNPNSKTSQDDSLTPELIAQSALWTNFAQTFTATRIPLIQLTVNFQNTQDGDYILEPKPGRAQGDVNKIAKAWEVNFSRPYKEGERKYIVTKTIERANKTGKFSSNYLNVAEVVKDFQGKYKTNPIEFLRSLGMDVSATPEIQNALRTNLKVLTKGLWDRLVYINGLKGEDKVFINSIRDLINIKLDGKTEDNSYKELLALESRYSDLYGSGMVYNASGDGQFEFSKNGTFTVQIGALNAAPSYNQLISDDKMNHLDYNRNPAMRHNLILKALFGENLNVKTKQETPGGRETFAKIQLVNSSGVSVTIDNEFANIGIATSDADEITNILQNFYTTLIYGAPATTQHSDKSSAYLYKIVFPDGRKNYVNIFKFSQYNEDEDVNTTVGNLEVLGHFMNFLDSEIQRIVKLNGGDPAGYATVGDDLYKNVGDKFVTFKDILSPKTQKALEDKGFIAEDFLTKINDVKNTALRNKVQSDILNYFNNIVDQFKADGDKFGLQKNQKLMRSVRELFINEDSQVPFSIRTDKKKENLLDDAIFRAFVLNDWIHKHETGNLFYGDVALYNLKKEEYHKRNAAFAATGDLLRTDSAMIDFLNNVAAKNSYADSEWFKKSGYSIGGKKLYGKTMNTAVLQDTKSESSLLNSYKESVLNYEKNRLGDKWEEKKDQIESNINKLFSEYSKMKEGDGQGWISFDSYRAMLLSLGKWSGPQEALYRRILRNEKVDTATVLKFFPVKKMQYFGTLKTDGLPVMGFHKFSLMPLIPSVIEGSNLEILHNRMVEQGIDYSLFQSGSKINTLTNNGDVDKFYVNNTRKNDDNTPNNDVEFAKPDFVFTKNEIFVDYFKDQTEVHDKFKGTILFSTQLRKLVEEGLMEQGVPTSFRKDLPENERKALWDSLSEDQKLKDNNYAKLIAYEGLIKKLIDFKVKELKKEMSLHFKDGKLVMSQKLIDFIKRELERQDLAEHEVDFIKFSEFNNSLVYDLSLHPSAETIEKLLVAIVNRRIIKQKVNGEALVQVSGAGFEKANIRKATAEENRLYNDVGLPTYEAGPDGLIRGMKVKIALQGDFKKLLKLPAVTILMKAERGRTRLQALNMLIRDEAWLNEGDNRKMITMAGVRIPVQGLNNMEFSEVYEFLPESAGNMIILPREIVAKAGSDFDIDKLFMMFPSLVKTSKGVSLAKYKEGSEDTIDKEIAYQQLFDLYRQREEAFQNVIDYTQNKLNEFPDELKTDFDDTVKQYKEAIRNAKNNLQDAFERQEQPDPSLYVELNELSLELEDLYATASQEFRDYKNDLVNPVQDKIDALTLDIAGASSKGIENDLLTSLVDILSMPENFVDLITPNSTEYVKAIADDISKNTRDYDAYKNFTTGRSKVIAGTRIYELGYNRYKQSSNNIGKKTLGLGAVDNTYNTLFNRVGAYMNRFAELGSRKNPYTITQTIRMPHNTMNINGEDVISLSNVYDSNNEYRISTLISQLMNGWVDVAKDAWIFDINGNKEVSPTLLFMLQAGVPLKQAIYFATQPVIKKYVEEQRQTKSTFARPLDKQPSNANLYRVESKARLLLELLPDGFMESFDRYELVGEGDKKQLVDKFSPRLLKKTIHTELIPTFLNGTDEYEVDQPDFSEKSLKDKLDGSGTKLQDLQALLHFIELEEMSAATTQVKLSMNFDTQRSSTLRSVRESLAKTLALRTESRFPNEILEKLEKESPIGAFKIYDEILDMIGGMFILRDHYQVNKLIDEMTDLYPDQFIQKYGKSFADTELLTNAIRNDFSNYVFQTWWNDPKRFNPLAPYSNLSVSFGVEKVKDLAFGAFVENGVLYVDEAVLNNDYRKNVYSSEDYWTKRTLSPVNDYYLYGTTDAERKAKYYKFVYKRETLRALTPFSEYKGGLDYQERFDKLIISGVLDKFESKTNFEAIVGRRAYEDYLRDTALMNTLNLPFMFKDDNGYASQVDRLTIQHKNLINEYKVLGSLLFTNVRGIKNLKLSEIKLSADEVNIYHDELERLADPKVKKVDDVFENNRISQLFALFPFFAFFQAGQGSKNRYSLSRLISTKIYSEMLSEASNSALKKMAGSDEFINNYRKLFDNLYSTSTNEFDLESEEDFAYTHMYMKDYSRGVSDLSIPKTAGAVVIGSAPYDKNVQVYNLGPKSKPAPLSNLIKTKIKANNNLVFAFDDSLEPHKTVAPIIKTGDVESYNMSSLFGEMLAKKEVNDQQAVGLITKPKINMFNAEDFFNDENAVQYQNNIKRIDAWIEKLKSLRDDEKKTIIFNTAGHGLAFLGYGRNELANYKDSKVTDAVALKSFVYLSERLYETFGYINPLYKSMSKESYSGKVLSTQPITNEMVMEKLRQCFYS